MLGSGSVIPRPERSQASYLLSQGKELFLFDCGAGTLRQLAKAGVDYRKIDNIFITHFHPDHVNDLPAIIIAHITDEKPRRKPLNIYGPMGFEEFFRKLLELYPCLEGPNPGFDINIIELSKSSFKVKGIKISTMHVRHTNNSIAYRIEHKGKVLVYSGDTGFGINIIKLAEDADVLVLECSFPDRLRAMQRKLNNHLTAGLCGEIASAAGARELILTHIYPRADRANIKKEAKQRFKHRVVLAQDLMGINV